MIEIDNDTKKIRNFKEEVDNINSLELQKNLLLEKIYLEAYGVSSWKDIPKLYHIVQSEIYSDLLKNKYSKEDWEDLDYIINHQLDTTFSHSALIFLKEKYLLQNRLTKNVFESPQVAFMLISATIFAMEQDKIQRLLKITTFYFYISHFYINLPTPILSGLRSKMDQQFSSCTLINVGDSIESITKSTEAIVKYASNKAGIGLNVGRIRAINQPIKKGTVVHTGIVPFIKLFEAALDSCSQGSVRKGSATLHYQWWHLEFDALIELKNNKGQDEFRARNLDYSVGLNKLFLERALKNQNVTLFSPEEVPELLDAFYHQSGSYDKFKHVYEACEQKEGITKKVKNATEMLVKIMNERINTGRIYIHFIDNMNRQSSFKRNLEMSNLCQEVVLPTEPCEKDDGEISMCTLSSINWGLLNSPEEMQPICDILVEALDNLLDVQSYMMPQAQKSTNKRRPIGVGITNFAYWLAKNKLKYDSEEALEKTFNWTEAQYYYLLKASTKLASIRGACEAHQDTIYSDGLFVFDFMSNGIRKVIKDFELKRDWTSLRDEIKKHSIRNSTVMAVMPVESSSIITGSTNGIEPVRQLVSIKSSKSGKIRFYAPGFNNPNIDYDLLWDMKTPKNYITLASIIQIFNDQAISSNITYNPEYYAENKIPMDTLISDLIFCYNLGLKTLYYSQVNDLAKESYTLENEFTSVETNKEDEIDCGCIL